METHSIKRERDKFLTEAMGLCYHSNWKSQMAGSFCLDCLYESNSPCNGRIVFYTWAGFGKLWEWAQKQDWWSEFNSGRLLCYMDEPEDSKMIININLIDPDRFADALYEYLKERI